MSYTNSGFDKRVRNLLVVDANAAPAPPPPDPPLTGLLVWYNALTLGLANGDSVNSWPDSSGNLRTATATAAAVFNSAGINGRASVSMDVGGSFAMPSFDFGCLAGFESFVVLRTGVVNPIANQQICSFLRTGPTRTIALTQNADFAVTLFRDSSIGQVSTSNPRPVYTNFLYNVRLNGGPSPNFGASGVLTSQGVTSAITGRVVGVNTFTTNRFGAITGEFAQLLVYNRLLTTAENAQTLAYLNYYYGV